MSSLYRVIRRGGWRRHLVFSQSVPQRAASSILGGVLPPCCMSNYALNALAFTNHYQIQTRPKSDISFSASGDTIYALSTAQGRAGIAVIRISGPSCLEVFTSLCPHKAIPRPRYATVRSLHHPNASEADRIVLDSEALVLYFPAPKTVTGEDVLELHIHGGTATVKAVLEAIACCNSSSRRVRYAEPGEFTKRAFINGRLDLAQVESLSDTLAAETEQQRRAAVRGNSGALGKTYEAWRTHLLLARGELEALIDFSEDQHFDESQSDLLQSVAGQIKFMLNSIQQHERGSQKSELLKNGIKIALVGPPNAGKSSLMNLIVGREASIVSNEAGTTRDIVEARLDIRGYLCSFADTAGFRSTSSTNLEARPLGSIEEEGIRRAKEKARGSDVIVVVASVEQGSQGPYIHFDAEALQLAAGAESFLIVVNKRDNVGPARFEKLLSEFIAILKMTHARLGQTTPLTVSCKEAQALSLEDKDPGGIHAVIDALSNSFAHMTSMPVDMQDLLGVTERQRQLLVRCRQHLENFLIEAQPSQHGGEEDAESDAVLAAEYLRYAADSLARITGKGETGDVEDVLGVVFEKFCVGK